MQFKFPSPLIFQPLGPTAAASLTGSCSPAIIFFTARLLSHTPQTPSPHTLNPLQRSPDAQLRRLGVETPHHRSRPASSCQLTPLLSRSTSSTGNNPSLNCQLPPPRSRSRPPVLKAPPACAAFLVGRRHLVTERKTLTASRSSSQPKPLQQYINKYKTRSERLTRFVSWQVKRHLRYSYKKSCCVSHSEATSRPRSSSLQHETSTPVTRTHSLVQEVPTQSHAAPMVFIHR